MDIALKNVDEKPWKNSTKEQEITAFEEKCARYISDLLTESPESEVLPGLEEKVAEQVDGKSCLGVFCNFFVFVFRVCFCISAITLLFIVLLPCFRFDKQN